MTGRPVSRNGKNRKLTAKKSRKTGPVRNEGETIITEEAKPKTLSGPSLK